MAPVRGGVAALGQVAGLGLHLLPTAAQGGHEDGLDDEEDVFFAGVVGADLGTLVGVEAALEEGAQDGGFDAGPVELADLDQDLDAVAV